MVLAWARCINNFDEGDRVFKFDSNINVHCRLQSDGGRGSSVSQSRIRTRNGDCMSRFQE
ncbi:hypothetical protein Plhal703r1_c30g0118531 [Plasmopara halstedii]